MRYSHPPLLNPVIRADSSIYAWSISKFLVLFGTFLMGSILVATVVMIYQIAATYLDQAYSRNAQIRALAQAHEINQLLVAARYELDFLARIPLTPESMTHHLASKSSEERTRYREIAFQGQTAEQRFVLVNTGSTVVSSRWTRPWARNSVSFPAAISWPANRRGIFKSVSPPRWSILPCMFRAP